MTDAFQEMINHFHNGFDGNYFFILYIVSAVYLFIFDKDKRWKFVFPSILLTLFILNPVCYKYIWAKTIGYSYWRLFWAIPVIPTVAMASVHIITSMKKKIVGVIFAALLVFVCIRSGAYIYSNSATAFQEKENIYNLPKATVHVDGWIVARDEHPRVVNDITIAPYAIQIYPEIEQAFGRWGEGRLYTQTGRMFYWTFNEYCINTSDESFDWDRAYRNMRAEKFKYLVLPLNGTEDPEYGDPILHDAGFIFDTAIDGYGIYEVGDK